MKHSEVVVHQVSLTSDEKQKKFYIQDIFNGQPICYDAGEFGLRKKHNMVMFSNDFSKGKKIY